MKYFIIVLSFFISICHASKPDEKEIEGILTVIKANQDFFKFIPELTIDLKTVCEEETGRMELMGTCLKYFSRSRTTHLLLEDYFPEEFKKKESDAPFYMYVVKQGQNNQTLKIDPTDGAMIKFFLNSDCSAVKAG